MNKITIQLKAKHYRVIVALFCNKSVADSFRMLAEIKTNVGNTVADDTVVGVSVYAHELKTVYTECLNQTEGVFAGINKEMRELLLPQMQEGVDAQNEVWIEVATFIQQQDNYCNAALADKITQGKDFLAL